MSFFPTRKTAMSVQKSNKQQQNKQGRLASIGKRLQPAKSLNDHPVLQAGNMHQTKYTAILHGHDSNSSNPLVTWFLTPVVNPLAKRRFINISSFSMMIVGTIQTEFPSALALRTIQLSGTLDNDNSATKILALAKPHCLSSSNVLTDISSYSIIYELKNSECIWEVPLGIPSLSFFVSTASNGAGLPTPYINDVVVQLSILQVQ